MSATINIIKGNSVTIQYGDGYRDEMKVSKAAFRISKSASDIVTIQINGIGFYWKAKLSMVTIQDGANGTPEQLTSSNWSELTEGLYELKGGMGGGSGALSIDNDFFFASATERDNYFTTNPLKLQDGIYVSVAGTLQQYKGGVWVDVSVLVRGEKGEKGNDGDTPNIDFEIDVYTGELVMITD